MEQNEYNNNQQIITLRMWYWIYSRMAEFFGQKHIVKVIAAMPYYPQWKITEYDKEGLLAQKLSMMVNL
jgi:hypothetical protein